MIWLYPVDGPPAELVGIEGEPSLELLQRLVQGYIEVVALPGLHMVINEEGKLHGMVVNVWATQLFRNMRPWDNDCIVGPAVVLSEENLLT